MSAAIQERLALDDLGAGTGRTGRLRAARAADEGVIQLADPGPAVETVNGQPVPQRLLDALARARNWDLSKPEFRERALKELTGLVLVADAARDEKFANDPNFAATVELSRLQGISAASYAEFQKRAQIDESVLRAEYDKQTAKSAARNTTSPTSSSPPRPKRSRRPAKCWRASRSTRCSRRTRRTRARRGRSTTSASRRCPSRWPRRCNR